MKHSGMVKVFFSILIPSVFLCLMSCQTVPGASVQQTVFGSNAETYRSKKLCTLLTKAEVGAALKIKMAEPEFFVNECTYKPVKSSSSFPGFGIQVSTDDGSGFNYNKESGKKQRRRIIEVKGIGDSAYFDDAFLNVLKGNVWLLFSAGANPSKEAMKTLAKKAVDRLQ